MSQHTIKIIVNPAADLGRAWRWTADLRPIVDEYGGADWVGTVYPTHATELAYQAALSGYKLVIAVGGDGTVHEVINGLMKVPIEYRPLLGVMPFGSGNDFAYNIGMQFSPVLALRQIFTGKTHFVDVGSLQDAQGRVVYWNNTIGIGFDTAVVIRSRNYRLVRGLGAYLIAVIQTIIFNDDASQIRVTTDSEAWNEQTTMLVLCNGAREGGGFTISPSARPDDGVFNYVGVRRVSRLMMFRLLPEVMKGTHGRFRQVRMGQFHRLDLQSDRPLVIHTDGEIYAGFGMNVHNLSVEIIPKAIRVMV